MLWVEKVISPLQVMWVLFAQQLQQLKNRVSFTLEAL